jgi:acyl carrier protein
MPLSSRLVGDLGYDSLALIELAVELELEFELDPLDESAIAALGTVGDAIALVEQSLS